MLEKTKKRGYCRLFRKWFLKAAERFRRGTIFRERLGTIRRQISFGTFCSWERQFLGRRDADLRREPPSASSTSGRSRGPHSGASKCLPRRENLDRERAGNTWGTWTIERPAGAKSFLSRATRAEQKGFHVSALNVRRRTPNPRKRAGPSSGTNRSYRRSRWPGRGCFPGGFGGWRRSNPATSKRPKPFCCRTDRPTSGPSSTECTEFSARWTEKRDKLLKLAILTSNLSIF